MTVRINNGTAKEVNKTCFFLLCLMVRLRTQLHYDLFYNQSLTNCDAASLSRRFKPPKDDRILKFQL